MSIKEWLHLFVKADDDTEGINSSIEFMPDLGNNVKLLIRSKRTKIKD